jgi:putative aldouronate transport system substrate-binding protein
MKKISRRSFLMTSAACAAAGALSACGSKAAASSSTASGASAESAASSVDYSGMDPIDIRMYYSDNATLPYKEDWLTFTEAQSRCNAKLDIEAIPIADYATKVSLALNTGENVPDVILYQSTTGENASLALNGALVPISDYSQWTPNFNKMVETLGLQSDVDMLNLRDGKRYYMPSLFDQPFYDGGLILREDFLTAKGIDAPKTFDDLYAILKAYKAENPNSYPLTILAGPRVLYRMTMPSYGISVGKNSAGGSYVLSWDYDAEDYFMGAIDDKCKQYFAFFAKLYKEGLLDPEMADPIDGDKWSQKMATGASMATWAYYDQIGGVEAASELDGFKLQMYPPLEGPAGAHHQQKSKTGSGIMFPAKTADRDDFERIVRTVDEMFFSEENAKLWCLGVEGKTYTMDGDKVVYSDDIKNGADGIYKTMQLNYGCGSDVTQMVWINQREMTKYDENYADINATVALMPDAIQTIPPTPLFDDATAEDAASLRTPLGDTFEVWADAFLTGKKSTDTDWDAFVSEMKNLSIEEYCTMYNDNLSV